MHSTTAERLARLQQLVQLNQNGLAVEIEMTDFQQGAGPSEGGRAAQGGPPLLAEYAGARDGAFLVHTSPGEACGHERHPCAGAFPAACGVSAPTPGRDPHPHGPVAASDLGAQSPEDTGQPWKRRRRGRERRAPGRLGAHGARRGPGRALSARAGGTGLVSHQGARGAGGTRL